MGKRKSRKDLPPLSEQLRRAVLDSGRTRYAIAQEAGIDAAALHRFVKGGWLAAPTMDALARVLRLRVISEGT